MEDLVAKSCIHYGAVASVLLLTTCQLADGFIHAEEDALFRQHIVQLEALERGLRTVVQQGQAHGNLGRSTRDAAVSEIVNLCMKANDLRTARILFRAIQTVSIREDVLGAHPELRR